MTDAIEVALGVASAGSVISSSVLPQADLLRTGRRVCRQCEMKDRIHGEMRDGGNRGNGF